ncbi:MAG TPA: hypothetical protein VNS49_17235 [Streptomyces sp.]|nr:hypothetical protein [Streptomyces sp.]
MRKSLVAVATAGVLSLGAFVPSALAQPSAPSGDTRAQSASQAAGADVLGKNCDKAFKKAKAGYAYSYNRTDCKDYLARAKGNSSNWSSKSDNKATSLLNKGVGKYSKVKVYDKAGYKGGKACLKQSELYADDLRDNKLSNGKGANNRISAHKWVSNGHKGCGANLT